MEKKGGGGWQGKKVVAVPDAAAVRSVRTCFIFAAERDVILQPAPGALRAPSKARLFLSVATHKIPAAHIHPLKDLFFVFFFFFFSPIPPHHHHQT